MGRRTVGDGLGRRWPAAARGGRWLGEEVGGVRSQARIWRRSAASEVREEVDGVGGGGRR